MVQGPHLARWMSFRGRLRRTRNLGWGKTLRQYYVYIMASHRGTLYTGVTNDLERRAHEHRNGLGGAFTTKYNVSNLVYYETTGDVTSAIKREKQIKAWRRSKRVALIEASNPYWQDLAQDWYDNPSPDPSLRSG